MYKQIFFFFFFFLMIRRPPRSTRVRSSAASDVYKRQVQVQPVAGEEALDLPVRLDADGQHDHVVLGLDDRPAMLDVLVPEDQIAVGLFGDPGDAAFDVGRAHGFGAFVELVIPLARRSNVHVVDGHLRQWESTHDELVLLDRIHAAEPRTERVVDGLVAGTGAHDVSDPLGHLAVAGPEHGVVWARGGEQPVHLHAGDHVLEPAVAVFGLGVGGEQLVAGGDHGRRDLDLLDRVTHVQMNRVRWTDGDALLALRAHAAVQAVARAAASLRLGQRGFGLGEISGSDRRLGNRLVAAAVQLLAAEHLALAHELERIVQLETVERFALQPAVDHVGGTAALTHGSGYVRGAGCHVACSEDVRHRGLKSVRICAERAVAVDGELAEGRSLGRHPDGHHNHVARHRELAPVDRLGTAAARRVRLAEGHASAAKSGDLAGRVADDLDRRHLEGEADAIGFGVVYLGLVGWHLFAASAVGHRRIRGAESNGGPGGVHGDVATAHDHDSLAGQVRRRAELRSAQEPQAAHDSVERLSRQVEA